MMKKKRNKLFYFLYKIYQYLVFIPVLFITTLLFGFTAALLAFTVSKRFGSYIGGVIWARLLSYATPISVNVEGSENIDNNQSYVIISNHQSQYDILVLYGWIGVDFKWVMKQELRKIPGLGIGCETIGHIFIDRSNHQAALASINQAKQKIINGTSVIFFPEGTRQTGPDLGQFKKGAFKMALELGLPLLPVTIIGTRDILPPKSFDLYPGKVALVIHPPINTESYSEETLPELIDKARNIIASRLPNEHVN